MKGCRSVGKPGYGSVATSTARGRRGPCTRKPSGRWLDVAPAAASLSSAMLEVPRLAVADDDVAAGQRRRERPGAGDDPVRHDAVLHRVQPLDALDLERRGGDAVDAARPSGAASGRGRRSPARAQRCR